MSIEKLFQEDRRLVILRILAEAPGYEANESILHAALDNVGHAISRDVVRAEMAWLGEIGLLKIEDIGGIRLARITSRGSDVAAGRAQCPGVKRPAPRE